MVGQTEQLGRCIRRSLEAAGLAQLPDEQLLTAFLRRSDQSAFAALLRRHGPLVLSACRQVLRDEADVEDVFQATFLVLLRKAGSIRRGQALAGWLFRVARHLALKVQSADRRRRQCEGQSAVPDTEAGAPDDLSWREACAALHEELDRLPEKYRLPLVLCYLQGLSRDETARQLGWTVQSLKGRLERGRQLLRDRLARRGFALSAGLLSALVSSPAVGSVLPPRLVQVALHAATGGRRSAAVAALVEGATRVMFSSKVPVVAALVLVAGLLVGGAALRLPPTSAAAPSNPPARAADRPARPQAPGKPAEPKSQQSIAYSGRVLGPDGRPVPGAKLHMTLAWLSLHHRSPSPEYATTGPDGRFAFTVPKARFGNQATVVAAAAANHGVGWVEVPADGKRNDLTIRLVEDDVPITGQVVDLEGKPVSGATLTVLQINAAPKEDLGPWLDAVKAKKGLSFQLEYRYVARHTFALPLKVTTDAAGRFKLTGIGRNRLVAAQLDGPTIASQQFHMLTRPGLTLEVPEREDRSEYGKRGKVATYYGSSFRHVAAPTKPVVGVVRDRDTKKPLAGVTVRSYARAIGPSALEGFDIVRTTTDAQGRYRLVGMPKGEGYKIVAIPDGDRPYLAIHKDVPDSPGLAPVTVDFELKRGVWIEGKITDKVTGKPLKGSVEYFSLYSNPNLRDYPGFDGTLISGHRVGGTKEDGSYRVVGLPGPGLVAVVYIDHYLRAPDRDDEYGIKEKSLSTAPYQLLHPINYGALARIDPAKGVEVVKRDVTFDPGLTFTGRVLGPDGEPLAGARGFGLTGYRWWEHDRLKTAEFTVRGFNPRWPRDLLFQHSEKGLVGVAQPPKKSGGAVTVRLEPGAAVTGRLVDADGKPRAGVELEVWFRLKEDRQFQQYSPERSKTDREGRFRIQALLPGYEYRLSDGKGALPLGVAPRSGQTKDLGDVKIKRFNE